MSEYTPNLHLFKYNPDTDGKEVFSLTQALNDNWDILDERCGSQRNIGEIVASTIPLTDAGLHLLDGALIQGSGVYSAFVTFIAGLVSTYPDLFTTEANWQNAITKYGVCGKFVYDSTNNTVRLPKYSNKIYTQDIDTTASVIGNGMTLGLTDGTTFVGSSVGSQNNLVGQFSGVYGKPVGTSISGSGLNNLKSIGVTTDPTKSGILADLSNITTSLDGYYYIVVATSTKTDIQVDIDEITTDLNGKADIDLSNVPNSKGILTESYKNGTSWYRVYSDGWCEQGGQVTGEAFNSTTINVTFLKPFVDTTYCVLATRINGENYINGAWINNKASTSMTIKTGSQTTAAQNEPADWQACGYIR